MKKGPRRDRRRDPAGRPSGSYRSARQVLAALADDVAYLEVKESLGEHLTPRERFALELAREAKREGGMTS